MNAGSDSWFKVGNRWSILSAVVDIVLPLGKLKKSDNFNVESKSLRNILNNIGSDLAPYGRPKRNVRKSLFVIGAHMISFSKSCFLRLRYE